MPMSSFFEPSVLAFGAISQDLCRFSPQTSFSKRQSPLLALFPFLRISRFCFHPVNCPPPQGVGSLADFEAVVDRDVFIPFFPARPLVLRFWKTCDFSHVANHLSPLDLQGCGFVPFPCVSTHGHASFHCSRVWAAGPVLPFKTVFLRFYELRT